MADRHHDLVVANARCVATVDGDRRELTGGWVAITDGLIADVGTGLAPSATTTIDATDCLVTPGLVNTHHHLYQWMTRGRATGCNLFEWLVHLYPIWNRLSVEDVRAAIEARIPPRRVPFARRLFWRLVFFLVRFSAGRALLSRLVTR